jgi:hypothetical protein
MDCKHCENDTGTRSKSFCSIECMRRVKHPENYYHCKMCGIEFYSSKDKGSRDYCSRKCLGKANHLRVYEVKKPQILEGIALGMSMKDIVHDYGTSLSTIRLACKQEGIDYDGIKKGGTARIVNGKLAPTEDILRGWLAKALLIKRSGGSISKCFNEISGGRYTDRSIHNLISKHCTCYKRLSKMRRACSKIVKQDRIKSYNSSIFKKESDFIKYLAKQLGGECEVVLSKGRVKKCDVVATVGGIKYAIECKTDCRTTRLDAAIGQAMVSAWALGAHPAIGVPSDCGLDPMTKEYCEHAGIRIFRDDSQLPITFNKDQYNHASKAICEDFWNGMFGVWSAIRGTEDVNPKTMQELGFSKKQISSIFGMPLDDL